MLFVPGNHRMFDQLKALSQLGPMMAKAREMEAKIKEIQARLPFITASGSAGGSLVTAVANGHLEVVSLTYNTSAPLTDGELLADLTRAAVNQALKNVKDAVQKEMEQAAGGMDLGALRQMLGQSPTSNP
jgi:DNA-binding YbaB/EbfC family protein